MSSADILDLIHTDHTIMNKIEYAIAMRQLCRNEVEAEYDVMNHGGFHVSDRSSIYARYYNKIHIRPIGDE